MKTDKDIKKELERLVEELENPFDKSSGLNESAHNGFEVARLKILRKVRDAG
jgi:hypothetical protein